MCVCACVYVYTYLFGQRDRLCYMFIDFIQSCSYKIYDDNMCL